MIDAKHYNFAFLDEATTALDKVSEKHLYGHMRAFVKNFITIGYRNSLAEQHTFRLDLAVGGKSQFQKKPSPVQTEKKD